MGSIQTTTGKQAPQTPAMTDDKSPTVLARIQELASELGYQVTLLEAGNANLLNPDDEEALNWNVDP